MRAKEAEELLQKYFEGETSLEEEQSLRIFFLQEEIPGDLLPYRKWFVTTGQTFEDAATDGFTQEMAAMIQRQQPPVRFLSRKMIVAWSGIAASVIIIAGSLLFYLREPDYRDTFSDPAEAMAYAEKTLTFVSEKYNRGLATLAPVSRLKEGENKLDKNLKTIRKGFREYKKIQFINHLKTVD